MDLRNDKSHYMVTAIENNYELLKSSIKEKISDETFIYLGQFLLWVFSVREKIGYKDKDKNVQDENLKFYKGLKDYYDMIKHNYKMDRIIKTTIIISPKTYPFCYPYTYGISEPIAIFQTIKNIRPNSICYEKMICNNTVNKIIDKAKVETLELLNNYLTSTC